MLPAQLKGSALKSMFAPAAVWVQILGGQRARQVLKVLGALRLHLVQIQIGAKEVFGRLQVRILHQPVGECNGLLTYRSTLFRGPMRTQHKDMPRALRFLNHTAKLRPASAAAPVPPCLQPPPRPGGQQAVVQSFTARTGEQQNALLLPQLLRHWVIHGALIYHRGFALVLVQLLANGLLFLPRKGANSAVHRLGAFHRRASSMPYNARLAYQLPYLVCRAAEQGTSADGLHERLQGTTYPQAEQAAAPPPVAGILAAQVQIPEGRRDIQPDSRCVTSS